MTFNHFETRRSRTYVTYFKPRILVHLISLKVCRCYFVPSCAQESGDGVFPRLVSVESHWLQPPSYLLTLHILLLLLRNSCFWSRCEHYKIFLRRWDITRCIATHTHTHTLLRWKWLSGNCTRNHTFGQQSYFCQTLYTWTLNSFLIVLTDPSLDFRSIYIEYPFTVIRYVTWIMG